MNRHSESSISLKKAQKKGNNVPCKANFAEKKEKQRMNPYTRSTLEKFVSEFGPFVYSKKSYWSDCYHLCKLAYFSPTKALLHF